MSTLPPAPEYAALVASLTALGLGVDLMIISHGCRSPTRWNFIRSTTEHNIKTMLKTCAANKIAVFIAATPTTWQTPLVTETMMPRSSFNIRDLTLILGTAAEAQKSPKYLY